MTKYAWFGTGACISAAVIAAMIFANETPAFFVLLTLYLATFGVGITMLAINLLFSAFAPKGANARFLHAARGAAFLTLGCAFGPVAYVLVLLGSVIRNGLY